MSADGIFLKLGDKLQLLEQRPYAFETVLQEVLATHPEVIAGVTTSGDREARLLLIRREMGVPSSSAGGSTFSLDHLFVDDEGVPVLVEVKRSSDTRGRREVVAQMLDYAANAVAYWPVAALQDALTSTATSSGRSVTELLDELRPSIDQESFWDTVAGNLRQGRVRLIFVADELPESLVRIIEFLNEQMNPAEVLGVEVRQFVAGPHVAYVPRLIGSTSTAAQTKSATPLTTWSQDDVVDALQGRYGGPVARLAESLMADVDTAGGRLVPGRANSPSVSGWYPINGRATGAWSLNANTASATTRAYLQIYLAELVPHVGSDVVATAAAKFERIPSMASKIIDARTAGWRKWPSVYLPDIADDPSAVTALLDGIKALTLREATASSHVQR